MVKIAQPTRSAAPIRHLRQTRRIHFRDMNIELHNRRMNVPCAVLTSRYHRENSSKPNTLYGPFCCYIHTSCLPLIQSGVVTKALHHMASHHRHYSEQCNHTQTQQPGPKKNGLCARCQCMRCTLPYASSHTCREWTAGSAVEAPERRLTRPRDGACDKDTAHR